MIRNKTTSMGGPRARIIDASGWSPSSLLGIALLSRPLKPCPAASSPAAGCCGPHNAAVLVSCDWRRNQACHLPLPCGPWQLIVSLFPLNSILLRLPLHLRIQGGRQREAFFPFSDFQQRPDPARASPASTPPCDRSTGHACHNSLTPSGPRSLHLSLPSSLFRLPCSPPTRPPTHQPT